MNRVLFLTLAGFGLIAVCYGFARYAFGLFLPGINAELSLSPTVSGLISGGSFFGYCITIILGAYFTELVGPRLVAICAALVAAAGMFGIAWAPSSLWLAGFVLLAGASAGLASPPMASAVSALVKPNRQSAINTIINAGTSAGVVFSGPMALTIAGQWRLAFIILAFAALVIAVTIALSMPDKHTTGTQSTVALLPLNNEIKRLSVACFLMGASSTAIWSFGSTLAFLRLGWTTAQVGLLWVAIGAAGIVGAVAGSLISYWGINRVHWFFLITMAASILIIGIGSTTPFTMLIGGILFGAAYITLSGIYLVWGIMAMPSRPATGLTIGFLALAIGQTAGAPVFGLIMDRLTIDYAVIVFASLALVAGLPRAKFKVYA